MINLDKNVNKIDIKVFIVDSDIFAKNYKFLDGYDDIVECVSTAKVYKSNYQGSLVQLVKVSNMNAMEKIEIGMAAFRNQLISDGF